MNKIKITILLLVSALVLLFSSCGGMMTADTDDVSIDFSSVVSKATGDASNWVKIWLFPKGSVSPYTFSDGSTVIDMEIPQGKVITIENIPAGQVYDIYVSLGVKEDDDDPFAIKSSYSGSVSVTGGTSTAATISNDNYTDRGITPLLAYTGKSVKGAAVAGGTFYTTNKDGNVLYKGTSAGEVSAPTGFILNSVDEGINNSLIVSSSNNVGEGFLSYDGAAFDDSFADGLAEQLSSNPVDVLSADVFWDDTDQLQIILGYLKAGLVIGMSSAADGYNDWFALPLGDYIEEMGVEISKQLINGVTAVMQLSSDGTEITGVLVYMLSEIGNYCIPVTLSGDGMDLSDGDIDISELLNDFTADNSLSERKLLNMVNPSGKTLYIGTDNGLYKATATTDYDAMNPTLINATKGKRIKYLAATEDYVACVTPLELIVMKISDSTVKTISFNEGLPVENGLLTNGLTGIDWYGTTLYVAGNYGVTKIDATQLW